MAQTILITGCSSGFGKLTAKLFHEKGWNVIATMRSPEKETELTQLSNILVTRLDVKDNNSVKSAIQEGIEKFGTIDVLVNNAGYGGHALFEQFGENTIYDMYETNVFGLMRVTREVLPLMRKKGNGTIINVTSVGGFIGVPTSSIYSSTKFAVEGLSQAMAVEYKDLGIKIKTVAPGAFGTNFNAAVDNSDLNNGDEQVLAHINSMMTDIAKIIEDMLIQGGKVADPQEVADVIYKCVTEETPVLNPVGADAQMFYQMKNSMEPQEFLNKITELIFPKK